MTHWKSTACVWPAACAFAFMAFAACADDFAVSGASTATNAGHTLDGGDSLSITTSGSITVSGGSAVSLSGTGNSVTNDGTLRADGTSFNGIMSNTGGTIVLNNGLIDVSGDDMFGFYGMDGERFTNTGTVRTSGPNGDGISVYDGGVVVNTGTVSVNGASSDAIWFHDNNTITNSGTISAISSLATGLYGNDNNAVTNTGSISVAGFNTFGIVVGDDNSIANSGPISVTGIVSGGIVFENGNSLVNSGPLTIIGGDSVGIGGDDNNTIVTSGPIVIDGVGNDGIYVENGNSVSNSGPISVSGDDSDGIDADSGNTITNSGTISATGKSSWGINIGADNHVTNTGAIIVNGTNSAGIATGGGASGNAVFNTGLISVTGDGSAGIGFGDDNAVTNSGTIKVSGDGSFGLDGGDDSIVRNTGAITVHGDLGDAIDVDDDSHVINTGFIETFGKQSDGIDSDDGNTIINRGRIIVHGVDADAIDVDENSTITNTGYLVSLLGNAIELYDGSASGPGESGNTLNLLPGSFLGGAIDFGNFTSRVNIETGGTQSVLWHLPSASLAGGAPTVSGPVPSFYDAATGRFATVDPTSAVLNQDTLVQLSGLFSKTWQALASHPPGGREAGTAPLAYADPPQSAAESVIVSTFDSLAENAAPRYWAGTVGGTAWHEGNATYTARTLLQAGLLFGADADIDANLSAGIIAGYVGAHNRADAAFANSYDNRVHTALAGLYGHWGQEGLFAEFAVAGGASLHEDTRLVNSNLATGGISHAEAEYGSVWLSPETAAGIAVALGQHWQLVPAARLKFAGEWTGGRTEHGSAANAHYDSSVSGIGQAALELGLRHQAEDYALDLRLGYSFRKGFGDAINAVTVFGQTAALPSDYGQQHAVFADALFSTELGERTDLTFGAHAALGPGYAAAGASIGLSGRF